MTKRAQSGSQAKKFNRCTLNVRDFPLERFRLERDGRKWKQAARSRSDLLLKLSTYANSDGTFQSDEKNFSPSAKNLLRHFAEDTFYRLSNDLRELGLVSWVREQKHYGRRIYTIHLRAEKQVRYSQRNTSDIRQNTSDQQGVITPPLVGGVITSDIRQNQNKTADLRPDTGTSLRLLTSLPAGGLTKNSSAAAVPLSSSSSSSGGNDDDDRERNRRRDLHAEREILRIQNLKAKALSRFQEKHPGEVEPSLVNLWLDAIEERAKKQIVSENYFLRALENEFHQHAESTVSETRERIPAQDSANGKSDRGARLFWADKFAKSVAVSVEKAREKVLEVMDEKGLFKSWEQCRDFCAQIRTDVFPRTPEPREDGENYFPDTVLELLDLVEYTWKGDTELYGFGPGYDKVMRYLLCSGKFESPEARRKFEARIAHAHEQKKDDEERRRYRDKVNRRNRERRAERKSGGEGAETVH